MNMELESGWHWFYVACMFVGVLIFWGMSRNPRGVPRYEYLVALMIPLVSGLAYAAMAFGYGQLEVDGRTVYYARYLDWLITTPLLVLALSWTAMLRSKKDYTLIAALMGTDALMVVCGLLADLSSGAARYSFYIAGVVAFGVLLWLVWGPLRQCARAGGSDLARVFDRVAGLLSVLWVCYPALWLLGPSGLGLLDALSTTVGFVLVPVVSKVGWSLVQLLSLRAIQGQDTASRSAQPA